VLLCWTFFVSLVTYCDASLVKSLVVNCLADNWVAVLVAEKTAGSLVAGADALVCDAFGAYYLFLDATSLKGKYRRNEHKHC
jgi:hypothetical protein